MRATFIGTVAMLGLLLAGPAQAAGVGVELLKLPLRFEPAAERPDGPAEFVARGPGYAVLVTPSGVRLQLQAKPEPAETGALGDRLLASPLNVSGSSVRLNLLGANPAPRMTGLAELPGKVNYFKGNDPAQWRTNIATYRQVKCEQVYPGIDLVFYGNSQEELEYDFVVAPGADPNQIGVSFTGADNIEIADNGDLVLQIGDRQIMQRKPRIYQFVNGREQEIAGSYTLHRDGVPCTTDEILVSFSLSDHDTSLTLIIDPVLSYSTYLGGSDTDAASGIAVDTAGNAYITGTTYSPDFPTNNAIDGGLSGPFDSDAFVVKINPAGSGFVYATYLGGNSGDQGTAVAVDADGNAYVTGFMNSTDFPVTNAFLSSLPPSGKVDAFMTKLNSDGSSLLYSTKLGDDGDDSGMAIAVGTNGNVWITGTTSSTNFPTRNAVQPVFQGGGPNNRGDVFVARFDTTLSGDASLIYSTYLGGNDEDSPKGIALDAAGNAYVTGYTASTNFPTSPASFQPAYAGGDYDAFVAKFNSSGSALVYSTFLGGTNRDNDGNGGGGIAVDSQGNAYVTGQTSSDDFPTKNAWQPTMISRWQPQVGGNGFMSKLNPDGSDLVYSTFLLGVAYTGGIAVDQADSAYVTGIARENFSTVNAVQTNYGGADDAFILKLDPDGQSALYATYLGGANGDYCGGIAIDTNGSAYVAGYTSSTNFPTRNAIQPAFFGGAVDAFIARISDPDTNPPVILAVSNYGDSNVVTIDFSEALNLASATNATHYALDHGVTVGSVMMGINSKTVRLVTSGLTNGVTYTLTVNGMLDRAPVPNSIAPDTYATFTALGVYRGFLHQKIYRGINGFSLADLTNNAKFPDHPDATNDVHQFEILQNAVSQSGTSLSGYLLPPVTGDYTFYLSSLAEGALFLSKNESPLNLIQIAWAPSGGGSRNWNYYSAGFPTNATPNNSLPVHLEAGRAYYVEALVQSSGGNVLGVNWRVPGQPAPRNSDPPIAGNYLALLGNPQNATLIIVQQPQDVTLAEGQTAAFSLKATASPAGIFYQWRKNGLEIPGANGTSFITPEVALAEDGDLYDCVLTIPGATATTRSALLTVTNDVTSPALVSAEGNLTWTNLTLTFSEPVNVADAMNTANYTLSGGLTVSNAILLVDRRTVILTTSVQTPGSNYTVQVSGIRDRSVAGNSVTAGTQSPFFGWVDEEFVGPFASWANVKEVYGAVGDGVADDTAALQQALDEVATPGHAAVLYFPTGTYRITQTLNFNSRLSATLAGEDPVSTIIKWDGATNADMMFANSVAYSRWTRLTWDGSGRAGLAVHHGYTSGAYQVTANLHTDEIFRDVGTGLAADPANGGDGHTIVRCHFLRCSQQGIAMGSYNAIDWHVWDSLFEDCKYGLRSFVGNFHVYRSLFLRSTVADVHCSDGGSYYGIRGNTSIGSKAFVEGLAPKTIQGNTVIDSLDPISVQASGPMILLDNTIRSRADATNGPVVDVDANLLSVGNTFTAERPTSVAGRSIAMEDQVVNRDSFGLPPPMVPSFVPNRHRPVIEIAAGANATAIQQAIDTAASMNGLRPVIHLPTGTFLVDHTLVIPAGCDVQLVGDGFGDGDLSRGTLLSWIGPPEGPLLRLAGPSRATLREIAFSGGGVVIDNCDQPGARVFMEHVYSHSSRVNLLVDRLDNTDLSMHYLDHGSAGAVSVKVIGGAAQAAGQHTSGRVDLFGGQSGVNELTYQVEHGGRLMVQDCWYEGHEKTNFMKLTDSGTFTLNNAQMAVGDAVQDVGGYRAVKLEDFHGQVSFLNTMFTFSSTLVSGDGSATDLLLLGSTGFHVSDTPWLVNQSPNATVKRSFAESRVTTGPGGFSSHAEPDVGETDPIFLRKMLAQVRTETPRRLVPLPPGVTDVRLFRVDVNRCRIGIILSGLNAPPELPPIPTQFGNEESLLLVTNVVTGPDAPFGLYYFTLGADVPAGMVIDPDTGVIRWTPTEAQGPSTNEITVIVTALSSPTLRATNLVTVVVREVNQPPGLLADRRLLGMDIGTPGDPLEPGSTTYQPDGSIEVVAGGIGAFNTDDHLQFSYEQLQGDFDVGVEIVSLEAMADHTSAGIMARTSLDADSPNVHLVVKPPPPIGSDYAFWAGYRAIAGAFSQLWRGSAGGGTQFPTWFRLQRQGQDFRALLSYDGANWQLVDSLTLPVPFPDRLFVGLCTWSRDNSPDRQTRAVYRNYRNYPTEVSHAVTNRTVNEGEAILFRALARDPDVPSILTFSLDPGAPDGASIDPNTGLFQWTPNELQGPGSYTVKVKVEDNGSPALSDTNTFTVNVREVNTAPVLAAIGNRNVNESELLTFLVSATDPNDVPANQVTLSVDSLPAGAAFDPFSGVFTWTPSEAQGPGVYSITMRVTDDGVPSLSDAESITITVIEPPRPVTVSGVEVRDGQFRFTFAAQPGKTYLVQAKNNLDDPAWIDLLVIPAPPALVEFAEPLPGTGTRYYRVITND